MQKAFNFLMGLLLGAAVGTAVAFMLAPESGNETQAVLRRRVNDVLAEGRRAAAERRAELEAQFAEAKRATRGA